jgi:hypothetical protein
MLDKCVAALEQSGCKITRGSGTVTVRFPPASPYDPPDGAEMTYADARFAFLVTKTFLELAEQGTISSD